jgi:hypothetical protein
MKLSKKEREKLENELRELTTPKPVMTMEDLKVVELRGAEILTELIDDDILTKIFELGEKQNKEDE